MRVFLLNVSTVISCKSFFFRVWSAWFQFPLRCTKNEAVAPAMLFHAHTKDRQHSIVWKGTNPVGPKNSILNHGIHGTGMFFLHEHHKNHLKWL